MMLYVPLPPPLKISVLRPDFFIFWNVSTFGSIALSAIDFLF